MGRPSRPGSSRSSVSGSVTGQRMRGSMSKGGQYGLQVHRPQGSIISSSGRSSRRLMAKMKIVRTVQQAQHMAFMPEASQEEPNGWQLQYDGVKSRIGALFNSYTLSDVIFQVEVYNIPAHRFVLGAASPIFYKQLYEELEQTHSYGIMHMQRTGSFMSESGMSAQSILEPASSRHVMLPINDVPHLAFFEFIQFIYTDNVNITLDNVLLLMVLSDQYKVAGLTDRCFDFIRSEVMPHSVLRVLSILRELLLKAVVSLWKSLVEDSKEQKRFRQLTLAERRARMDELNDASSIGSALSRRESVRSARSGRASMVSIGNSSDGKLGKSRTRNLYRDESEEDLDTVDDDDSDVPDMAIGFGRRKKKDNEGMWKGSMLSSRVAGFVEEQSIRCWKCIIEDTALVMTTSHMWDQDLKMLRDLLRLDNCSVTEIEMFRCANTWAEKACIKAGISVNAQSKRAALGQETLHLIRFPCMSLEQFQWEVVPTGLLPYEDVQELLSTMAKRAPAMHMYNTMPRSNITLKSHLRADSPFGDEDERGRKPIYRAVEGDHLDTMLGAELLRAFLKEPAVEQDLLAPSSPTSSSARLPPISSPRATPGTAMEYLATMGGGIKPPSARRMRRSAAEMVMGSRLDNEDAEDGIVVQAGGRKTQPHDFVRLCHGLYQFREDLVVELFVHNAETMVINHGANSSLAQYHWNDPDLDPKTVRARLHLPERDSYSSARGVPLAAFLCRQ